MSLNYNMVGWFPQETQEELARIINKFKIDRVIEIGSFVGLSTTWFAARVSVVCIIEPFNAKDSCASYLRGKEIEAAQNQEAQFWMHIKHHNLSNVNHLGLTVDDVGVSGGADMTYIDGDHTYQAVLKDIAFAKEHTSIVICGDDYHWPNVRKAVDESFKPEELKTNGRFWWVVKSKPLKEEKTTNEETVVKKTVKKKTTKKGKKK